MKRFVLIILTLSSITLCQLPYQWGTLDIESVMYDLYTISNSNHFGLPLPAEWESDVENIVIISDDQLVENYDIVSMLATSMQQIYQMNQDIDYITNDWLQDQDIFEYGDN